MELHGKEKGMETDETYLSNTTTGIKVHEC